eukprot:jgi/Picre1/29776/NNA_005158.t1
MQWWEWHGWARRDDDVGLQLGGPVLHSSVQAPWASWEEIGAENSTTKQEVVIQARVEADEARFDLAKALVKAQGDYKFEVIEAVANVMQSQVKYFEHGHAVAQGLLPYIDESLKYVEALKEDSKAKMDKLDELIEYERTCSREHDLK